MKKLLLLFIFSWSLNGFSQDIKKPCGHNLPNCKCMKIDTESKPDTLRAVCLVTMCRKCAAEPRMGFVVIAEGKEVEYLDCRKRALKMPQVGWGYKVVNANNKN